MAENDRRRRLCVGTAGWSYRHWRGLFYPEGLPQRRWLEHYAEHFDTVEVNSTFYHLPRETTLESWRRRAPEGFVYALKASRFITHEKLLVGAEGPTEEFLSRARLLEDKLGPVLFQLPPRFGLDLGALGSFLELLPADGSCLFEFRNESWYVPDTFELLQEGGACFCTHDMPRLHTPRRAVGPAAYVRFHGPERRYAGAYPERTLAEWADWLAGQWEAGRSIYAYFNNDIGGHAVHDARALREMLRPLASANG
jgi:uncharacterized protein YecE (DUF72 family)